MAAMRIRFILPLLCFLALFGASAQLAAWTLLPLEDLPAQVRAQLPPTDDYQAGRESRRYYALQASATGIADDRGQATFSFLPTEHLTVETGKGAVPTSEGGIIPKGPGYTNVNESAPVPEVSAPFVVLGRDDHPSESLFEEPKIDGGPWTVACTGGELVLDSDSVIAWHFVRG